ncbi:PepSY-associated TM helix domain-containing protein [Streptomyces decoyicus]|uniref:PepSY-associated TM helix domain-containing protein n=1 Tax=Streptomyces decoyicus TaxID=249567 RepID=UPI0004AB9BB6|nr:PepSY domain-containing protein [Streptomyces decoyicus]KOG49209.1 peptidase [Streptomyces decoyicus]QZY19470.1 PepSY domain-containing protein [Streptomyces decoyicus]
MPTEQRLASSKAGDAPDAVGSDTQRAAVQRTGWSVLRPLVLRLHFYAGVLVAPFLLVTAVTGLLYAGSFQAEKVIYAHELSVPAGEHTLPVSRQVAAARKAHPEGKVAAVRPAPQPGDTTRVLLSDVPGVTAEHQLAVFVDPHTGSVRGALETYGATGALPMRTWLDDLHRNLHLGEGGRLYSELAASWLWVVAGGGLALWIGRKRTHRKLRALALPDRAATGRRRTLSWHGAVGVWAAVGLFFLSATGLTWSTYAGANIDEIRRSLGQATPTVSTAVAEDHAHHGGSGGMAGMPDMPGMDGKKGGASGGAASADVGIDKVLEAARAEGLSNPVEIGLPTDSGSAYVVKQVQRSWPEKQDAVAVDPGTGKVTDVSRFADHPVLAKLTRYGIDLHTGTLFGIVNQIALAALALALIFLIVLGYRMWWQRRPTRAHALSFGRPIPRGAWRQTPLPVLIPLVLVVAVVGWAVPLLGISLAAFLVVDILLGVIGRRRVPAPVD